MVTRLSPGVTVTVNNDSFYAPAIATTVPLLFIATQANKTQVDGVTAAVGTQEHGVVRTVTSVSQSLALYGSPAFGTDVAGDQLHGDCRNEYGLFALNSFLAIGGRALVVRANIDLADASSVFMSLGTPIVDSDSPQFFGASDGTLSGITVPSNAIKPDTYQITMTSSSTDTVPATFTVTSTLYGFIGYGTVDTAFTSSKINLTVNEGAILYVQGDTYTFTTVYRGTAGSNTGTGKITGLVIDPVVNQETAAAEVWTITFTSSSSFTVTGSVSGSTAVGTVGVAYDNAKINFTIVAGTGPGSAAFVATDSFTITTTRITITDPLGATQSIKRANIVQALQSTVNSNLDVRSPINVFNLIACPGYHELVDELIALNVDTKEEALVLADVPCNLTTEQAAAWSKTSARVHNNNIAYYYPWGFGSNYDGANIVVSPTATALRTIAYNDSVAYVWSAPAGPTRGLVTGITTTGYVSGTLGTATTFVETILSESQMDLLYEYGAAINPITSIPNIGLVVWGQKTSASLASALDRINVARLLCYMKRRIRLGAMAFVFEPNIKHTRDNLKAMADSICGEIYSKNGLYDFATVCDTTNNTADIIDLNQMFVDIYIKPVKTAEFIFASINVLNTGDAI